MIDKKKKELKRLQDIREISTAILANSIFAALILLICVH